MEKLKLIFIYNADSGLFNTVTDIAHKIFSPSTYACQLCALTHSYFSMRDEWKNFLQSIEIPMEFLHKDEFVKQYPSQAIQFPSILLENNNKQGDRLIELIDASMLNNCKTLDELKALILEKVST